MVWSFIGLQTLPKNGDHRSRSREYIARSKRKPTDDGVGVEIANIIRTADYPNPLATKRFVRKRTVDSQALNSRAQPQRHLSFLRYDMLVVWHGIRWRFLYWKGGKVRMFGRLFQASIYTIPLVLVHVNLPAADSNPAAPEPTLKSVYAGFHTLDELKTSETKAIVCAFLDTDCPI